MPGIHHRRRRPADIRGNAGDPPAPQEQSRGSRRQHDPAPARRDRLAGGSRPSREPCHPDRPCAGWKPGSHYPSQSAREAESPILRRGSDPEALRAPEGRLDTRRDARCHRSLEDEDLSVDQGTRHFRSLRRASTVTVKISEDDTWAHNEKLGTEQDLHQRQDTPRTGNRHRHPQGPGRLPLDEPRQPRHSSTAPASSRRSSPNGVAREDDHSLRHGRQPDRHGHENVHRGTATRGRPTGHARLHTALTSTSPRTAACGGGAGPSGPAATMGSSGGLSRSRAADRGRSAPCYFRCRCRRRQPCRGTP